MAQSAPSGNVTKLTLTDRSVAIEKLPDAQSVTLAAGGTTGEPILVARPADFSCGALTAAAITATGNTFRNYILNKTVDNDC